MKIVVIPATYNEKGNIERLITILEEEAFPKIKNHDMYILVADDNSPDGTADVVRDLMKKWKNLDVSSGEKKGLGAAYVRAMTYAIDKMGADIVCEIDADLSHDPREIPNFIKKLDEGNDIVVGTRYSNGGSMPENWPFIRKLFSVTANLIVRSVTGRFKIHDWTGGFRALKKEVFLKEKDKVKSYQGYTFQVAFLFNAVMDGFKVGEVPIHFADRTLGRSKIAPLEYIINLLTYIIIARIKELQRFIKFLFVGGTGFIVQVASQELSYRLGFATALTMIFASIQTSGASGINATAQGVAAGIGAEAAILSNFFLNNFWTFNDTNKLKETSSFIIRLLKFNTTSLVAIFLQGGAVALGVIILGDSLHILSFTVPTRIVVLFPTIIFLVIPLNYFIYNKFIWKTHNLKNEKTS
jgi:dolichol-phosphate mannosyltransferase